MKALSKAVRIVLRIALIKATRYGDRLRQDLPRLSTQSRKMEGDTIAAKAMGQETRILLGVDMVKVASHYDGFGLDFARLFVQF